MYRRPDIRERAGHKLRACLRTAWYEGAAERRPPDEDLLPTAVRHRIDHQRRLYEHWSERWLPFPAIGGVITAGLVANLAPGAALAWPVAVAAALHYVGVWLAILVVLLATHQAAYSITHSLRPSTRAAAWRRTVTEEYFSWRPRLDVPLRQGLASLPLGLVRWFVRIVYGLREHNPDRRMSHARRWALAREVASLIFGLAALLGWGASLTILLWKLGVIDASNRPSTNSVFGTPAPASLAGSAVSLINVTGYALHEHVWNLANSIPVLELSDTLHWPRPTFFLGDRIQSALLLIIKLTVGYGLIAYIVYALRQRESAEAILPTITERAVVKELYARKQSSQTAYLSGASASDTQAILEGACRRLISWGVPPPRGESSWTSRGLAAILSINRGPT